MKGLRTIKPSTVISLLLILIAPAKVCAQEFFINADFVSSSIWRGMKCRDASVEPTLGFTVGGFTVYAWGSTEFKSNSNEIDLYLDYEYKGLKVGIGDYFSQDGEQPGFFDYKSHSTFHTIEFYAGYTFSEKFPLSLTWNTIFAGNDYKENGKRAYSTYIEAAYPFTIKGVDLKAEVGFTPWEGDYSDKFNVTNIGLSASKVIKITDAFSLPISAKLIANPFEDKLYFVFGVSL